MQVVRWQIRRFEPYRRPLVEAVRSTLLGLAIRVAASLGFVVLIVGRARTGKTYLMDRICGSSKVLNKAAKVAYNDAPLSLDLACIPEGLFAIDEADKVANGQLQALANVLRTRRVIYAMQRITDARKAGLNSLLQGRPVLVIDLQVYHP